MRFLTVTSACALVVVVTLSAQGPVVPFDQVSSLKATFPFVRFSTLSSFEVPPCEFRGIKQSPDVAPSWIRRSDTVIPASVTSLDGRRASVRGYMLPLDDNTAGGVHTFVLTSTIDSCHWGMIGKANEWILVEIAGGGRVPFLKSQPVTVFGTLRVKPSWSGDRLSSLYEMTAELFAGDGR